MKENESREICTIFEKFNRSSFPITTETKISDLEINSILFIHAIIEVEKKFDVLFEDEFLDMSYFKTVEIPVTKKYSLISLPAGQNQETY